MAKVKLRDLIPATHTSKRDGREYSYSYFEEFRNLLCNSVSILQDSKPMNFAVEQFIKEQLIDRGAVGYDKIADKFAIAAGQGVNELGDPTIISFFFLNGTSYTRKASYEPKENGAYILYGLPSKNSLASVIQYTTDFMEMCDNGIWQNAQAIKTPYIVTCKDDATRLSLLNAMDEKETGQAAIMVAADIAEGLKAVDIGTEYVADKLLELRDKERDHLLNKMGIMSANINKKERVQVGEVNATLGQVIDYIYMLVDTFNKQCESYGLPFTMELNNALKDVYLDDVENEEAEDDFDEEKKEGEE